MNASTTHEERTQILSSESPSDPCELMVGSRCFAPHLHLTLAMLCEMIIPADGTFGGATAAGVPAFIDLLASENTKYRVRLKGGLMWLDSQCLKQFGKHFIDCDPSDRDAILQQISYTTVKSDPDLSHGQAFLAFVRKLTLDGFFTSQEGIAYLGYVGNQHLAEFQGCPDAPSIDQTITLDGKKYE